MNFKRETRGFYFIFLFFFDLKHRRRGSAPTMARYIQHWNANDLKNQRTPLKEKKTTPSSRGNFHSKSGSRPLFDFVDTYRAFRLFGGVFSSKNVWRVIFHSSYHLSGEWCEKKCLFLEGKT